MPRPLMKLNEEAEVEWFSEDLQDLLEITPKKDVLFIMGDWNAKVGSQEIPKVTGKFGLGVQSSLVLLEEDVCYDHCILLAKLC